MKIHHRISKHHLKISTIFLLLLLLPFLIKFTGRSVTDLLFQRFLDQLFLEDVSSNGLNLHYTLADPEALEIQNVPFALKAWSPDDQKNLKELYAGRMDHLKRFPSALLSEKNRLTRDILLLSWNTECSPENQEYFHEFLSPSLGIQAQLPVLLAEYTFRQEQDVKDYLQLLSSVDTYFHGILDFEQEKARQGIFLPDTTIERILSQCRDFIQDPEDNYLLTVFQEKISSLKDIPPSKQAAYGRLHKKILLEQFLPAYEHLIHGLYQQKGSGKIQGGLASYPGGKEYYTYLLKSSCGLYEPVEEIQQRLLAQMEDDLEESQDILKKMPEGTSSENQPAPSFRFSGKTPEETLAILRQLLEKDFPPAPPASYHVKYVPEALEPHLSPAFYLTPPIDTLQPNDIYINRFTGMDELSLFTTLAHEGFPGHLYQTITFASTDPPRLRHLLSMGGYVEGWATYVESYAHQYARTDPALGRLEWLEHSLNLCVLSFLDTAIHYDGWTLEQTGQFLSSLGITDPSSWEEIYQIILEDPANYLKYYMGYLHFADLREECEQKLGDRFQLVDFHRKILEIGPCPFPILEREVRKSFLS